MRRGLKCPRCHGHNAYKRYDNDERGHYRQKVCRCGWEARKHYFNLTPETAAYLAGRHEEVVA